MTIIKIIFLCTFLVINFFTNFAIATGSYAAHTSLEVKGQNLCNVISNFTRGSVTKYVASTAAFVLGIGLFLLISFWPIPSSIQIFIRLILSCLTIFITINLTTCILGKAISPLVVYLIWGVVILLSVFIMVIFHGGEISFYNSAIFFILCITTLVFSYNVSKTKFLHPDIIKTKQVGSNEKDK